MIRTISYRLSCFLGLIIYMASISSYGSQINATVKPNNHQKRFIIKLDNNKSNAALSELKSLNTLLSKKIDKSLFTIKPIANNIYLLDVDLKLSNNSKNILPIDSNNLETYLKSESNLKYITEDKIGVFKPLPDPKFNVSLISVFNKKYNLSELDSASLEHSAQWDEFAAPEGVFLESKPNLYDGAWSYTGLTDRHQDLPQTVVAVLDTGVEYNNNLVNNVVTDNTGEKFFGWNFSANNDDLSDETGGYHGTHVAGTIASHGPNIMGMGTSLKILPVKIPDSTGMFYESNVIKAIYWAIGEPVVGVPSNPYPAKVINMSFGIDEYVGKEVDECSPAVQEAIDFARDKGVVIVVAAGNSNMENDLGAPAGCKGTLRIASTGPTGLRSYFSNFGEGVNFAAPGGDKRYGQAGGILSTVKSETGVDNSGFDFYQGTSMASPHVAGLAGLIFSVSDSVYNYTAKQVEKIMYTTTHNFAESYDSESSCVGNKSCGHGIINANNAIQAALANYNLLFSSPTSEFLDLKEDESCRNGKVSPLKEEILKPEGTWVLDKDSKICQAKSQFSHPSVSIDYETNTVQAKYGHVVYKLNVSSLFSSCSQVGYDGVGCYR